MITDNRRDLYNGNIGAMTTVLSDNVQDPQKVLANNYSYDQLNRITGMTAYEDAGMDSDNEATSPAQAGYAATYDYDPNGNLETLTRANDQGQTMDNLTYHLDQSSHKTNRLTYVNDAAGVVSGTDLGSQSSGNYAYDASGNLTQDLSEGIEAIQWNVQGKVSYINKPQEADILFDYDASGQRIRKKHIPNSGPTTTTYYVRDAQGNVMATYRHDGQNVTLREQHIYGSQRLGLRQKELTLQSSTTYHSNAENLTLPGGEAHNIKGDGSGFTITPSGTSAVVLTLIAQGTLDLNLGENIILYGTTGSGNISLADGQSITLLVDGPLTFNAGSWFDLWSSGEIAFSTFTGTQQSPGTSVKEHQRELGHKRYELSNHLGNVLNTITDRKVWKALDGVENSLLHQPFEEESYSQQHPISMENWYTEDDITLQIGETVQAFNESREENGMISHNLSSDATCYSEYCITFDNVVGTVNLNIYSVTENMYVVSGEPVTAGSQTQTFCFDISEYGTDNNLRIELDMTPGSSLSISDEYYRSADLPNGWTSDGDPEGMPCLGYDAGGLILPYLGEGKLGLSHSLNVDPNCSTEVCFTITSVNGAGQFIAKDPQDEILDNTSITSAGQYCITLSGGPASLTLEWTTTSGTMTLSDVEASSICDIYTQVADVQSGQDYYPGGSLLPGRVFNSGSYRYGYQGSEKDDEITGVTGAHITTHFRELDTRVLRWWSLDPKANASESPYMSMGGNPIWHNDPLGDTVRIKDGEDYINYTPGMEYDGDNDFVSNTIAGLDQMNSTENGKTVLNELIESENNFNAINESKRKGTAAFVGNKDGGGNLFLGESVGLGTVAHELFHGYQQEMGQGKASINNEVGAYLFGAGIEMSYNFANGGVGVEPSTMMGNGTEAGRSYQRAMRNLLWGNSLSIRDFNQAIENFKDGSQGAGVYQRHPILPQNEPPLISKFYPLIEF